MRFLIVLAFLPMLIALFYLEEDWRGDSDLEKFKREWEGKGENFDRNSVVPQAVPDDKNFAMSPVWIAEIKRHYQTEPKRAEAWYGNRIYSEEVSNYFRLVPLSKSAVVVTNDSSNVPNTPDTLGDWKLARMTDLRPWQSYYRNLERTNPAADIAIPPRPQTPAQDVLLALSKYDPFIERLRHDSQLPCSRFPIDYNAENPEFIFLPHLDAIRECTDVLEFRAIAELQNRQNVKALADVNLVLRLADAIRIEPFLYSHETRMAILQTALQPIYEGLANHDWSDSQLGELGSKLSKFDFLTDCKFAQRGEMIISIHGGIEFLHRYPGHLFDMGPLRGEDDDTMSIPTSIACTIGNLIPAGWYYQNELHIDRAIEEFYLPVVDTNQEILSPTSVDRAEAGVEADVRHLGPYNVLERCAWGLLGEAMWVAYGQNSADLSRVAIALERYRIVHGEYPDSLNTLVPQFIGRLPHDIINGQPLHYRRTADGQFLLYSVGWNEKDDGGEVGVVRADSTGLPPYVNRREGDWVWRYPEKPENTRQTLLPKTSLR